jgi:hypothetical protein
MALRDPNPVAARGSEPPARRFRVPTRLLKPAALAVALALGGQAQAWDPHVLKAPGPVLRIPFNVPGCYPSGSTLGSKGQVLTFTRAGTQSCTVGGSAVTCQANEACVEDGGRLVVPSGATVSFAWPAVPGPGPWCVAVTLTASGRAWALDYPTVLGVGAWGGANSAKVYNASDAAFYVDVYDGTTTAKSGGFYPGALTNNSEHRLAFGVTNGALRARLDSGAVESIGTWGTGTGTWAAAPTTLYLVSQSTAASAHAWKVSDVRVCKADCGRCP